MKSLRWTHFLVTAAASLVLANPAKAQTTGGLAGQIVDANTQNPVTDAVVIATSAELQGEQTAVTDGQGQFEISLLPSGSYTLTVQREGYQPFTNSGLKVQLGKTIRVKLSLVPEGLQAGAVEIVAQKPSIAVTSTETGANISKEQMNLVPYGRNGRGFEQVATSVPGVHNDLFGLTLNGAGSSESTYIIDGVQVNDPAFGTQGTTLLQDFIQEVEVKTGGYQAEYGRSTGGIVNVVTKSGGNEFHGSVFVNFSPYEAPRRPVGSTFAIANQVKQNYNLDFGAELGGPIIKDRLWFYAGFAPQILSLDIDRVIQAQTNDGTGNPVLDSSGLPVFHEVGRKTYVSTLTSYQFTGKLTFLANENHSIALALYGNPTNTSAGVGNGNEGVFLADAKQGSVDIALRYQGKLLNKAMLVEAGLGYHYQDGNLAFPSPVLKNVQGISAQQLRETPQISWRGVRNLLDAGFDDGTVPDYQKSSAVLSACAVQAGFNPCPVQNYLTGGAGILQSSTLKRIAPSLKLSNFVEALGHHQFKYGADASFDTFDSDKYYSGGQQFYAYSASAGGAASINSITGGAPLTDIFYGRRGYGHGSPGNISTPQVVPGATNPFQFVDGNLIKSTHNRSYAAFAQDTWNILDKVTLDIGLRAEWQKILPSDTAKNAQGLPTQGPEINLTNVMPRLGLIYDFTGRGLSKVYASFGRFYEYIPLDLADRSTSAEQSANYTTNANSCTNPHDPRTCSLVAGGQFGANYTFNGASEAVASNLKGQYTDEYQAGVQYQIYRDITVGVDYVRKQLGRVVEDMSADDGTTYFLANPGEPGLGYQATTATGAVAIFPKPRRIYDGVTLSVNKAFSENYLMTASYTYSSYRGNYPGLLKPDTGQLDPNITSEYDLASLLSNRDGPLPGDVPNSFKLDSAYVLELSPSSSVNLGGRVTVNQGTPTNYLGAHPLYGAGEAYVLPRGSGPRLPWNWQADLRASYNQKLSKDYSLGLSVDLFNVTNNREVLAVDENYTFDSVNPIVNGTVKDLAYMKTSAASPVSVAPNANFGRPTAYQVPFSARIGAKLAF